MRPGFEFFGYLALGYLISFYSLFHVNRQHWGFVALYRRKNGEGADALERTIDMWFFHLAIWLPYAAMLVAPWVPPHRRQAVHLPPCHRRGRPDRARPLARRPRDVLRRLRGLCPLPAAALAARLERNGPKFL